MARETREQQLEQAIIKLVVATDFKLPNDAAVAQARDQAWRALSDATRRRFYAEPPALR